MLTEKYQGFEITLTAGEEESSPFEGMDFID